MTQLVQKDRLESERMLEINPEEGRLLDQLGVKRDDRSNVLTSFGRYATSLEGVFSAGDMRRGQSLVVWAIQEGRSAAREVDQYLMKTP